jgi:hypothetical protein
MSFEVLAVIVLLGAGAFAWWRYHSKADERRRRAEMESDFERPDHARSHEMAKVQADLSRWSGPH